MYSEKQSVWGLMLGSFSFLTDFEEGPITKIESVIRIVRGGSDGNCPAFICHAKVGYIKMITVIYNEMKKKS